MCDLLSGQVLQELTRQHEMPDEAVAWVKAMLDYNVKGGKLNRGLTVRPPPPSTHPLPLSRLPACLTAVRPSAPLPACPRVSGLSLMVWW